MSDTLTATREQKSHLVSSALSDPTGAGRLHIAAQMMDPIKAEVDYTGIGRQGFIRDLLEQGDIPYYDKDVKVPAVTLSKRGIPPQIRREGDRVWVNILPIASYPIIPIEDTRIRRYDILDRVQEKARADLAEEEDRMIFGNTDSEGKPITSIYEAAASATASSDLFTGANTPVTSNEGLTRDVLAAAYAAILKRNLVPEAIIMNPVEFVDLLLWGRDEYDPQTQREVLQTGRMGSIWNIDIMTSYIVPEGVAYMRTSDQYLGVFPILIDLEVMDAPDPAGLNYGFVFYEFIGAAIINVGGVVKLNITRSVT